MIFVAVALCWLAYLIPMALKRSDELGAQRPVEEFSDDLRVLRRTPAVAASRPAEPTPEVETTPVVTTSTRTRAAARAAATRRRRVLYVLLLATAITATVAGFGQIPWWSVAIPAGLIVAFLVIARITVRRENARYTVQTNPTATTDATQVERATDSADEPTEEIDLRTASPSIGLDALAEEGALWDPLPLHVPTYVGKAHVRRTVRTVDLTGLNSSGHDEADSKLAREADAARKAERAEQEAEPAERKVAGA
ncbi:MAG TPA: hypothetical protein PKX56_04320 [Marmoricola sp.]|nr:hypothetical protein [Marmoricola sp.]